MTFRHGGRIDTMVALIQDVVGNPVGIQRTYLDPAGNGQAKVPCPKKLSKPKYPGANKGAAIRLREVVDGVLGVAEGIITAESATQATGIPTWSTLSAGGMRHFAVPKDEVIRKLIIFADNDASGVGQNAAYDLARRLLLEGYEASVVLPANVDTDWNDVLVSEGKEAIRQALAAAQPFDPAIQLPPAKKLPAPTARVAPSAAPGVAPLATSNVDPVTELNKKHFVVPIGSTVCIATETRDPLTGNYLIAPGSQSDLSLMYRNWPVGKETAASVWLASSERREYKGIVFAPGREVPGYYNVFRGFSVAPKQGECNLFWEHLSSIICRGNQKHYRYFRKWLAHLSSARPSSQGWP